MEFSGYNGKEKVFGLVADGALASSITAESDYVWKIPKNWSLEEAATVPFSYALVIVINVSLLSFATFTQHMTTFRLTTLSACEAT